MGQMDLYQSDFYEDKYRFADLFNGVLFGGREIMKPEELENDDSVIVGMRKKKTLPGEKQALGWCQKPV